MLIVFKSMKINLKPLIENIPEIFSDFKIDIDSFLSKLEKNNQ